MATKGEIYLDTVYIVDDEAKAKLLRQGFGTASVALRRGQPMVLALMDEEAMYMAVRGLLDVGDVEPINFLWSIFCKKTSMFPYKYKTYTHFREKGYTVKSGTNFGMDYSVYRVTPSCSHSEFCVRVTTGDAEGNDWRSISTITRVMPDVMKLCVLSVVSQSKSSSSYMDLFDDGSSAHHCEFNSIICLESMEIRLLSTLIRRLPVTKENYLTIAGWQSKYRKSTKLQSVRIESYSIPVIGSGKPKSEKKHQRKRRNHMEIRSKEKSAKSGLIWESLNS